MRHNIGFTVLALVTSLVMGCAAESTGDDDSAESGVTAAATIHDASPDADIFADTHGWTTTRADSEFVQRYKIIDDLIYCESKATAHGTVADAVSLLRSEWDWYAGTVEDFTVHADGTRTYHLWPTGKLGLVNVFETMSRPIALRNGGVRLEVQLDGYGEGLAYVEIRPASSGEISIVGRFDGVRSTVLPTTFFAKKHLEAEGGKLGLPFFRNGGGFAGLKSAVESR
jgi:hypothetical protein